MVLFMLFCLSQENKWDCTCILWPNQHYSLIHAYLQGYCSYNEVILLPTCMFNLSSKDIRQNIISSVIPETQAPELVKLIKTQKIMLN